MKKKELRDRNGMTEAEFLSNYEPGDYVRPSVAAARRELKEETGVDHVYLEQLYTFSEPERDPRTWVMSCSYMALIDSSKVRVEAGDDADKAVRFRTAFRLMDEHTEYRKKMTYD